MRLIALLGEYLSTADLSNPKARILVADEDWWSVCDPQTGEAWYISWMYTMNNLRICRIATNKMAV